MPIRKAMTPTPGQPIRGHVSSLTEKTNGASLAETPLLRARWRYAIRPIHKPSLWAPTQIRLYRVTPLLKMASSRKSFCSLQVGLPLAKATMASTNSSSSCGIVLPWSSCPASKVDPVLFLRRQLAIGGDLHRWHKAAVRRAATGAEQHHMAAGAGQRAGGDRVVARRAQ